MTAEESALVKHHFEELDEELRSIVIKTPTHLTGEDLTGYLYFTLKPHVVELQRRQISAERRDEFELALAIQKFVKTRLKEYVPEVEG